MISHHEGKFTKKLLNPEQTSIFELVIKEHRPSPILVKKKGWETFTFKYFQSILPIKAFLDPERDPDQYK